MISWPLPSIVSLAQFPGGWVKQERLERGRKESSPQLSAVFFHMGHICNTFRKEWRLRSENDLASHHDVNKAPNQIFPLPMPKSARAVLQALTLLIYAFLIATDLWPFAGMVPACCMWEGTGSRRNVCGIITRRSPREGMLALYSGFILRHPIICNCLSRVKWWVLNHCPPSPDSAGFGNSQRRKKPWISEWENVIQWES